MLLYIEFFPFKGKDNLFIFLRNFIQNAAVSYESCFHLRIENKKKVIVRNKVTL